MERKEKHTYYFSFCYIWNGIMPTGLLHCRTIFKRGHCNGNTVYGSGDDNGVFLYKV